MINRIKLWFRNKWNTLRRKPAARAAMAISVACVMGVAVYLSVVMAFDIFASVASSALALAVATVVTLILCFITRLYDAHIEYPSLHGLATWAGNGFAVLTVFLMMMPLIFPMSILITAWETSKLLVKVVLA